MSRTIRRGPPPRRPTRAVRRKPKVSVIDRMIGALPVSEATLRTLATWSILGAGGAVLVAAAAWAGVPAMAGDAIAESAGRAGLRVEQVDITGLHRMDRDTVYALALEGQAARAILKVDLGAVRERLLAYGWVQDAYVSRRLPDTLLIHIVERTPAAIWQNDGQLTLIDATGRLLEPVDPNAMPAGLPLMIGPGADRQEAAYQALLDAAPALKPRIKAASWVGNRRWDLTFDTGETLALPQDEAAAALVKFARYDGKQPLLGKGWKRFDMRDPTRLVARKPDGSAEHQVPDDGTTPAAKPVTSVAMARSGDV